jgi:parvulin-like peptidyl-prolyl isomerase
MKIHCAHILVKHQYEAEDLQRKLAKGVDFAELAKKYSTCSSAERGGDLGLIAADRLDSDFVEAVRDLIVGEVSKPVRTRFGYHLIKKLV